MKINSEKRARKNTEENAQNSLDLIRFLLGEQILDAFIRYAL